MFNKILVPLDGSQLAECALPYAEELAVKSKSEVLTLVSVTELIEGKTASPEAREMFHGSDRDHVYGSEAYPRVDYVVQPMGGTVAEVKEAQASKTYTIRLGKMEKQAQRYLERIAAPLQEKGIPVSVQVLTGKVAESITEYAEEKGFDTIVMSSHGRTGPSRWAMGSVTDKIFRSSCIPVLMVRAPGCFPGV